MTPRDSSEVRLLIIDILAQKSRPVRYKELRQGVIPRLARYHDIYESDFHSLVEQLVTEGVVEATLVTEVDDSFFTYWLNPLQKIAAIDD